MPKQKIISTGSIFAPRFVPVVSDVSVALPYIMPVLVARLGQQEITESSEELRLSMVTMVTSFMDHCGSKVPPYLNDVITILQRTLVDPYHEVKKVNNRLLILCAKAWYVYIIGKL